jgi:hypothetical protein
MIFATIFATIIVPIFAMIFATMMLATMLFFRTILPPTFVDLFVWSVPTLNAPEVLP